MSILPGLRIAGEIRKEEARKKKRKKEEELKRKRGKGISFRKRKYGKA